MLKGLLAGGITLGVAAIFPEALVLPFLAAILGLAAGAYPGLAMANAEHGRPTLQWVVAVGILILGVHGLIHSPMLLFVAWGLHGLWALLHRFTALGDGVPESYAAASFSFDVVMVGFLVYMWMVGF